MLQKISAKKWVGRIFVRTTPKNTHQEELCLQQRHKILILYFCAHPLIHVRNRPVCR